MKKGGVVKFDLPVTNDEREVIYYDCENIDLSRQIALNRLICAGFSQRLINTRKNASENKGKKRGCEFSAVNKKLQNMAPGEWQIYFKSKDRI